MNEMHMIIRHGMMLDDTTPPHPPFNSPLFPSSITRVILFVCLTLCWSAGGVVVVVVFRLFLKGPPAVVAVSRFISIE